MDICKDPYSLPTIILNYIQKYKFFNFKQKIKIQQNLIIISLYCPCHSFYPQHDVCQDKKVSLCLVLYYYITPSHHHVQTQYCSKLGPCTHLWSNLCSAYYQLLNRRITFITTLIYCQKKKIRNIIENWLHGYSYATTVNLG